MTAKPHESSRRSKNLLILQSNRNIFASDRFCDVPSSLRKLAAARQRYFSPPSRPLGTDVWRRYCSIGMKSCIFCFRAMNEMLCDGQTPMLAALDNSSVVFGVYRHHISREINHTEVLRKCDRFGELPNSDLEGTQAMPRPCFILISAYFPLIQRA